MAEPPGALRHAAALYDGDEGYVSAVVPFLLEGVAADEPALAAVPGERHPLLRDALDGAPVALVDMTRLGANPARIIPALRRFADDHAGRPVRFVGEPIWPSRDDAALREATRHEALLNLAFADARVAILCPYDAGRLRDAVIEDAGRTHPVLVCEGHADPSPAYLDPAAALPPSCEAPLADPPADAERLSFAGAGDLRGLRGRVGVAAAAAGLDAGSVADLRVAVSEVATNALRHGGGAGTVRAWREPGRLLCQIDGGGRIEDPLAGRRAPPADAHHGWGLLLANSLCDLVEIRTGPGGTTVRLHMALPG